MQKVVVMRGAPGSAKSTTSRAIVSDYQLLGNSTAICSTDSFFMGDGVYKFDRSKLGQYHRLNFLDFCEHVRLGTSVIIVDNTNIKYKDFKNYVEYAITHNYKVEIVEPDVPWKYDALECHKKNTHGVPLETIQRMLKEFESNETVLQKIEKLKTE